MWMICLFCNWNHNLSTLHVAHKVWHINYSRRAALWMEMGDKAKVMFWWDEVLLGEFLIAKRTPCLWNGPKFYFCQSDLDKWSDLISHTKHGLEAKHTIQVDFILPTELITFKQSTVHTIVREPTKLGSSWPSTIWVLVGPSLLGPLACPRLSF